MHQVQDIDVKVLGLGECLTSCETTRYSDCNSRGNIGESSVPRGYYLKSYLKSCVSYQDPYISVSSRLHPQYTISSMNMKNSGKPISSASDFPFPNSVKIGVALQIPQVDRHINTTVRFRK